jgi:hypothetical protein
MARIATPLITKESFFDNPVAAPLLPTTSFPSTRNFQGFF